ncbi:hypothetical protein HpKG64_14330 [Helicobacter pylori]
MTNAPKVKDKPAYKEKLLNLRERSWKNQRFTETITLIPKKANSKYNDLIRAFATFVFHGMLLTR